MNNPFDNIQNIQGEIGRSFQQGLQAAQQFAGQNALSNYAANPDDPDALKGLARHRPEMAMQVRQQQQVKAEARVKLFARAAKAGRTAQMWDANAKFLSENGHPDAAKEIGMFSPERRAAYMAQGGEEDDAAKQDRYIPLQPGGSVARIGADGRSEMVIMQNPGDQQAGAPVNGAPQLGQPAPKGVTFTLINGGPAPQAPDNFLDPLAPSY